MMKKLMPILSAAIILAGLMFTGCPNPTADTSVGSSAKAITSFGFAGLGVTGTINELLHTIAVYVPDATDLTILVPSITASPGATIYPASGTAQNFTSGVIYTVTAADGSKQAYSVVVAFASKVMPPQFSPVAGTYDTAQNVTISCATNNTVIFYTTNGSDPGVNGALYTAPVSFSSETTIRAIAYDYITNLIPSDKAQAMYKFIPGAPDPTVSATAADNNKATVTLSSAANAASYNIYYAEGMTVSKSSGIKITNATSPYTVSGLKTDKYYSFIVTGVNANGEGAASPVVTAKIYGHWEVLGSVGFSDGAVDRTEIAVASDGTPYVLYQDGANSNKATVKKYNSSTGWVTVGSTGFSAGGVGCPRIAIDSNNVVYVAYQNFNTYISVQKFNSSLSAWEPVGSDINGITTAVTYTGVLSLAIAPDNTPYFAISDVNSGGKATVMKFNGSTWEAVGSAGISANIIVENFDTISLTISKDGTPYVAYAEYSSNNTLIVKKFSDSAWSADQFVTWGPRIVKIMTDSEGVPYVGYTYEVYPYPDRRPRMTKYKTIDGTTKFWALPTLSSTNEAPALIYSTYTNSYSIAMDANDTAYAAFLNAGAAMVRRFNAVSNAWEGVGIDHFSASGYISIAIDRNSNTPYVAFVDGANDSKATVMVYK
jgi:hypothetical protein